MIDFNTCFKKKKAVIIGATSGIGAQVSRDLSILGADLILVARSKPKLIEFSNKIGSVKAIDGDISTIHGCKKLACCLKKGYGYIDHLVITAGQFCMTTLTTANEKNWDSILSTNLKGVYFIIQNLLPLMEAGSGKSIVITSSILAHCGGYGVGIYSCSKGGLSILIKSLAIELAAMNIRINAVSPGHVKTPLINELIKDEKTLKDTEKLYPLGRIGTPRDISPLILFLLSAYASWITGSDYIIDGGRSAIC